MRKGVEKSEEWLNTLKSSIEEYSATPPKQGWESLSVAITKRGAQRRRLKFISAFSAVAAVALLFLLLPYAEQSKSSVEGGIAVVENFGDDFMSDVVENNVNKGAVNKGIVVNGGEVSGVVGKSEANKSDTNKHEVEKRVVQESGVQRSLVERSEGEEYDAEKYEIEKSGGVKSSANKSSVERDLDKNSIEPDSDKNSGLTWEEYLAAEPDKRDKKGEKLRNLLALQVGNGSKSGFKPSGLSFARGDYAAAPGDISSGGNLGFTSNPGIGSSAASQTLTNVEEKDKGLNSVQTLPLYNLPEPKLINGVRGLAREYNHKQPITFSLMVGKEISKRFTVESGLSYTLLKSDLYIPENDKTYKQQLHYIGLPLKFNWNYVNRPKFLAYAGAGAILEKSIYSKLGSVKLGINTLNVAGTLGAGAQYRLSNNFGIYLEPSMVYYFGMGDSDALLVSSSGLEIKSIRSEYPLGFMLNGGFRFSF